MGQPLLRARAAASIAAVVAVGALLASSPPGAFGALTPGCASRSALPAGRKGTVSLMKCGLCGTAELLVGLSEGNAAALCSTASKVVAAPPPSDDDVVRLTAAAIEGAAAMHGQFFLTGSGGAEENATKMIQHLVASMPRRDLLLLFSEPFRFVDFLTENVRHASRAWPVAAKRGVPWDIFLEYAVPYAAIDEKRDLGWHTRRRLRRLLTGYRPPPNASVSQLPPTLADAPNATAAMRTVVALLPWAQVDGAQGFATTPPVVVAGQTVNWRSETAPAMLSPEQVVEYGGASCTGTAVILVAAARAVGIPARIAGCSQSIVVGDDHHWVEFYDASSAGPFGDHWHTKEGVSVGNTGGPWDGLSGPMRGCLRGVAPRSTMNTIWASSWSAPTYLPLQWSNSSDAADWSFVGGINRCGVYCTAWGCGVNQTNHWAASQCEPPQH